MACITAVMVGSSCDGIDIASVQFSSSGFQIIAKDAVPMPEIWKSRLTKVHTQTAEVFWRTHTYFGQFLGELLENYHQEQGIKDCELIGVHGFTIFHDPSKRITFQIGDPNPIAAITSCNVLTDFRGKDIALGGKGAPLSPMLDIALFSEYSATINLGGIANIAYSNSQGEPLGYDICACNTLLNRIIQQKLLDYDENGKHARMGKVLQEELLELEQHPFFNIPPPRVLETGFISEEFLPKLMQIPSVHDSLRTAVEHISNRISRSIQRVIPEQTRPILVTGGGAYNTFLIEEVQRKLKKHTIEVGSPILIEFKECVLIAYLSKLWLEDSFNSVPSLTHVVRPTINGNFVKG